MPKPFFKLSSKNINAGYNLANVATMNFECYHNICGIADQENFTKLSQCLFEFQITLKEGGAG